MSWHMAALWAHFALRSITDTHGMRAQTGVEGDFVVHYYDITSEHIPCPAQAPRDIEAPGVGSWSPAAAVHL